MAEFVDVMRNWEQMCGSVHGCNDCRLKSINDLCPVPVEPGVEIDWAEVEKVVEAWVAEKRGVKPKE